MACRYDTRIGTYIVFSWPSVNCADNRRSIWAAPGWLRQVISLLCVMAKEVFDRAWTLGHGLRTIEQIHHIVLVSYFVRHTASPSFDLVEAKFLFIVSRLTHIHLLLTRESTRTAAAKPRHKHNEATIENILDQVIPVLTGLDNFIIEEMFVEAMDGLLWSVVPACIDPSLSITVLPRSVDLGNYWLAEIVGVSNLYPIS